MDVKKHLIDLKGKQYLPVAARIVAFRESHPAGAITTELIATDPRIIVRASVHAGDGVLLASAYGTAPTKGMGSWAGREVEKSETAAIGRALAHAGFGTLYATDADDTDNLADSPIERPAANGWTRDQHNSLALEAQNMGIDPDELLRVLGVTKTSDYASGFTVAREELKKYAAARPKTATAPATDLFKGKDDR